MATALEVIGAKVVNPGAGPTACTPSTGDTFSVRFAPGQTQAFLVALWGQEATAGFVQVRSPKLHDPVRGFRGRVLADVTRDLGTPAIPILNSAGKGAIVVAQQNNAAAGTPNVDLILAELSG